MVLQDTQHLGQPDDTSFPIGLAGSLLATGLAVTLLCQQPIRRGLTWRGAAFVALAYVLTTALVHAGALVAVRGLFRDHVQARITRLLWALWIPIAWLPLLGVLTVKDSPWVLAVFPVLSIAATALLTQERTPPAAEEFPDQARGMLFMLPPEPVFWRALAPSFATAATLQGGVAALAAGHDWVAGFLFSLSCVVPAWRLLERTRGLGTIRIAAATSAVVVMLTWIALLPMLLAEQFAGGIPGLTGPPRHIAGLSARRAFSQGTGYSGIILLPPLPKHQAVLLPTPEAYSSKAATKSRTPEVIPFDGQYWYFKSPDAGPRPDARVVHADPLKAIIHSTDPLPLSMEAHQSFPLALPLHTASMLRLDLVNADTRPGTIAVEVILRSRSFSGSHALSLGSAALPSSTSPTLDLTRAPVHEALRFTLPRRLRGRSIDEISIRLLPEPSRARGGAEIAVQDFALLP